VHIVLSEFDNASSYRPLLSHNARGCRGIRVVGPTGEATYAQGIGIDNHVTAQILSGLVVGERVAVGNPSPSNEHADPRLRVFAAITAGAAEGAFAALHGIDLL